MANHKQAQPKESPAHALELAIALASKGRIKIASRTKTKALEKYINRIIQAMQLEWAMITDRSRIGDCLPRGLVTPGYAIDDANKDKVIQEECELLARKLGVPVSRTDTFVAVADRMRKHESD